MDPYRSITINPSMIHTAIYKMNEQSMDDDLESIDHLSINERTIGTRSKTILITDCQSIVNRSVIDETIIGYMEDEKHNDQDTCMIII